tara:strand:+ start:350 stop:643 length:294 start_codon:yes stop_codon:yes gene_type:complete
MALKPTTQALLKRAAKGSKLHPRGGPAYMKSVKNPPKVFIQGKPQQVGGPGTSHYVRKMKAKRFKLIRKLGGGRGAGSITPETTKRAWEAGMPRKLT